MNDIKEEGKLVNMLNETVSYTNWYWNEPNNYDPQFKDDEGDCVRISLLRLWSDASCFNIHALCSQRQTIG